MRKFPIISLLILLFLLIGFYDSHGQKIGYVDKKVIMNELLNTKKIKRRVKLLERRIHFPNTIENIHLSPENYQKLYVDIIENLENKILEAIKEVAKEEGYSMIQYKTNFLFVNEEYDVSQKVRNKLFKK